MTAFVPPASPPAGLRLDQLPRHTPATVLDVARDGSAEDQELALRLVEIGFLPGETVRVIAHGSPGGEPLAVRVGTSTFALRRHEAALVSVQAPLPQEAA
jgi:ferrous iron transport protein A